MFRTLARFVTTATVLGGLVTGGAMHSPLRVHAEVATQTSQPIPIQISAVGMVELVSRYQVVLDTSGKITEIAVEVGDKVRKDQLLIALDTSDLEAAVERAEIGLEMARIGLEELTKEPEQEDIAVAEANLLQAQELLDVVEAGPTPEELEALENSTASAWARYEDLKAGPTFAQINQAKAGLERAEVNLQKAQREYDKIAWLPEAAATDAADDLQQATINYEQAKSAFDEANKPTEPADLLAALSAAQQVQHQLNELRKQPTDADLADARAQVTAAEAALEKLTKGPDDADVRTAELSVRQALLNLEEAETALEDARVTAPIAGTVLELSVDPGQIGSAGSHVATLADTDDMKLVVNVEQTDISLIEVGRETELSLYALAGEVYMGVVEKIAPVSSTDTGSVTFPVTVRFTDTDLEGIRPGMTASANFVVEPPEVDSGN